MSKQHNKELWDDLETRDPESMMVLAIDDDVPVISMAVRPCEVVQMLGVLTMAQRTLTEMALAHVRIAAEPDEEAAPSDYTRN